MEHLVERIVERIMERIMERIRERIDKVFGIERFRNLRTCLVSLFPDEPDWAINHMMTWCLAVLRNDSQLMQLWKEWDLMFYRQGKDGKSAKNKQRVRRLYEKFINNCNDPIFDSNCVSGRLLKARMDR